MNKTLRQINNSMSHKLKLCNRKHDNSSIETMKTLMVQWYNIYLAIFILSMKTSEFHDKHYVRRLPLTSNVLLHIIFLYQTMYSLHACYQFSFSFLLLPSSMTALHNIHTSSTVLSNHVIKVCLHFSLSCICQQC